MNLKVAGATLNHWLRDFEHQGENCLAPLGELGLNFDSTNKLYFSLKPCLRLNTLVPLDNSKNCSLLWFIVIAQVLVFCSFIYM